MIQSKQLGQHKLSRKDFRMLNILQDFYFSLYISTWTSFKWLLLSVLIAIGCCLATFLFEFKGKTAQLIWLKFSMSLTAIFALFCLFMTLHGIIRSVGLFIGAISSFFYPMFGLLIVGGIILFIISLFNPLFLFFMAKN